MDNEHKAMLIDSGGEVIKGLASIVIASAIQSPLLVTGTGIPVAVGVTILSAVSKKRFVSSDISVKKLIAECITVCNISDTDRLWLEPQVIELLNKVELDPKQMIDNPQYLSSYSNELSKDYKGQEKEKIVRVINLVFTALSIAVRESPEYQAELELKVQEIELKVGRLEYSMTNLWKTLNGMSEQLSSVTEIGTFSAEEPLTKNNQKAYFINKWNESLFLHPNIKLKDIYTPLDVKNSVYKTSDITKIVETYLQDDTRELLIILGNPGLGKSSFMSYLANKYSDEARYIFIKMHDLDPTITKKSILDGITDFLNCRLRDLSEAVIFLDGYDELRVDGTHYELCVSFITDLQQARIKTVLSSRKNYIDLDQVSFVNDYRRALVVELKPFNKEQIIGYIEKYKRVTEEPVEDLLITIQKTQTDIDVFGIPFILYLICSLGINISEIDGMVSVYDKVFSLDGGMYDKVYDKNTGHYLTQNPQRKTELLKISEEIAYEMFRNNRLYAMNDQIDKIILNRYPNSKSIYAIGNYYHIENDKTYFVHKTFQEYFVVRYFIRVISDLLNNLIREKATAKETEQILFDIFYCKNYLYKRLNSIFGYLLKETNLENEKYRQAFVGLVPQLYKMYLSNAFYELKPFNNILKSQNYLSSIHTIINHLKIDTFYGMDEFETATIIKTKQYVHLNIYKLTLHNVDLSGAFLRGSLTDCEWSKLLLNRIDFKKSNWENTKLDNFDIRLAYGYSSLFMNCEFGHGLIEMVDFSKAMFESCNMNNLSISRSIFDDVIIKNCTITNLKGEDISLESGDDKDISKDGNRLKRVIFKKVVFNDCSFSSGNNENVIYSYCEFKNCVFESCQMNKTIFSDCDFEITDFYTCAFEHAQFKDCRFFIEDKAASNIETLMIDNKFVKHMGVTVSPDTDKEILELNVDET